jgi:DNA-binding IclR family transcriptional regulator
VDAGKEKEEKWRCGMSKTYRRIEAVRKAGEILKYLAHQKEPVNGPEIAKALDMAEGTVMCHMATLEDLGFVQGVGDRFKLGMGLALIWARVKSSLEADRQRIDNNLKELEG